MTIALFGGKSERHASRGTPSQLWSIREAASWHGCFTARGTGTLHKIDCIRGKENYPDILTQHLKTSTRKSKLGQKMVFQTGKSNKVNVWKWTSVCASKEATKPDWYTSSVLRNGTKFQLLTAGSLWKAAQDVWLKVTNLKAVLPNTKCMQTSHPLGMWWKK